MKKSLFLLLLFLPFFGKSQLCNLDSVTNVHYTSVGYTTATVTGTPGDVVNVTWAVKYVRSGQTDTATTSYTASITKNLTGLQSGTLYKYYYITFCPLSGQSSPNLSYYSFTTTSSAVAYTPMTAAGYQFKYQKSDSGMAMPFRDTSIGRGTIRPGPMVLNSQDSLPYFYNGVYWKPFFLDSAGFQAQINLKVDSVTVAGDSLFYWVNGTGYGQVITGLSAATLQEVFNTQSGTAVLTQNNTIDGLGYDLHIKSDTTQFTGDVYLNDGFTYAHGSPGAGKILTSDANGLGSWETPAAGTTSISSLTAATGFNTIDNAAWTQTWNWTSLGNAVGLTLLGNSTTAASNGQTIFQVSNIGSNSNSGQTTYSAKFDNTHSGTSSTNVAGYFSASTGTTNYAIQVGAGNVNLSPLTASTILQLDANKNIASATIGTGLTLSSGVLSNPSAAYLDSLIFNQASLSQFNIKFNKAKYGTASSKCSISIIGDSNTDTPEPFNKPLRALLLNYGKVDPGWIGFNPYQYPSYGVLRSVTVGWTKVDRLTPGLSLNLDDISSNDNTQYVQFETTTFNIPYDSLRIYFYKTATSGSFSIQVDAGTVDTVATAGANVAGKYTLSGMSNTAHLITIRPVGNGAVRMLGAYAYSSDASFVINKIAHSGADSYDFASFAPATWDYIYTDIGSDLAIINLGTNDEFYDTSVTNYQTNLGVLYDRIIADAPQSSVAFLAPGSNSTSPSSPQINYINAVINVAISKKAAFASLYKYWGLYPNNQNNGVLTDGIHYNLTFAGDGNAKLIGELLFTNQPNPIYTGGKVTLGSDATGDIWYRNSSGNFTRLGIGTTAQTLHVVGGLPAWRDTAAAAGIAIGNTITSATQGSVLFAGASGVLAQANSGLFYDASNVRLGLGLASPTYDFQLEKTVNGSVGVAIVNQSGGTSGAARIDVARSFGGDYFGSLYYAGDGNTIYTPLTFNILASASSTALNITHTGAGTINFATSNTVRGTISSAGAWRMNTYGAGAATFDASGNITSVSDIRLKNKQGNYSGGLKELMQINPIIYKWKPESGMETKHDYIGFSAQNIRSSLGEDAIGINKQGYLSIQDRAILAVAINAIQELKELNDKQQKEIDNLKQIIKNK